MQDAKTNPPGPTDTVPAWLSPGEAVLNKGAAELIGRDKIAHVNRMGMRFQNAPGFYDGTNNFGDGTSGNSFGRRNMGSLERDPATQPSMPKGIIASDPKQANVPNGTVLAAMRARDTGMGVEHAQNLMDMLPDNTPTTHSSHITHPDGSLQAASPGVSTRFAQQQPLRQPSGMRPLSAHLGGGTDEDAINLERQSMLNEDSLRSASMAPTFGARSDSPDLDSTIHRLQFSSAPGFVDGTERIKHVEDPADYYINHGDKPLSSLGVGNIPVARRELPAVSDMTRQAIDRVPSPAPSIHNPDMPVSHSSFAGDPSPSEQLAGRGMRGKLDYYDANNSVSSDVSREMERAAPQRMPLSVAPRTLQSGIPLHGGHYEGDAPVASQGRGITPRYDPVSGKLSQEAGAANAEVDRLSSLSAGRGGHAADPEVLRAAQAKAYEANQAEQMRKGALEIAARQAAGHSASEEPKKSVVPQSEQKTSVTTLAPNDPNRMLMVNDPEVDQATKMKVRAGNPVDPTNLQSGEGYIKTAGGMRGYRSDPVGQHTYAYDGKGGVKDLGSYRSPLQRADETSQQFAERMRSHIAAETEAHDFKTQQDELMDRANRAFALSADPNIDPQTRQALTHIGTTMATMHGNNEQNAATRAAAKGSAAVTMQNNLATQANNADKTQIDAVTAAANLKREADLNATKQALAGGMRKSVVDAGKHWYNLYSPSDETVANGQLAYDSVMAGLFPQIAPTLDLKTKPQ